MAFSTIDPVKTWKARQTDLYITDSSNITISSDDSLFSLFSGGGALSVSKTAKNVTVTPPPTDVEKVDFLGLDSNGFQNALLDSKPPGLPTCTGTLILGEDETLESAIVVGSTTVAGSPASTRYQLGNDDDLDQAVSVLVNMQDFAQDSRVSFCFHNAKLTKFGDVRISGADGHWEQDFTITCLPRNFYWEYID